jgi:hypothetical protein
MLTAILSPACFLNKYKMQKFPFTSTQHNNRKSLTSFFTYGRTKPYFKPGIQPKLTINQPGDIYEQEADVLAERVMRMSPDKNENIFFKPANISSVQRKYTHCEEEEKIQKKSANGAGTGMEAPSIVHDVINSGGKPLDAVTRHFFEPRFGRDFSNIRIHTDSAAAKSTEQINALAYTAGDNIVFNQNQYAPDTDKGKRLLGHELTHAIQQNRNQVIYRKSYLDTEKITDAQTVDSETKVKKVIYETLSEITSRLYPYIKDKIPVFKSKAVLHIDDPETFGYKFKKINNQQDIKDEDVHKSVQGFVDPKSQYQIYLNTRSKYCHAFHEAIHSISNLNTILAFFGIFLTEGLTQYFTDVIFLEQTGSKCKSHNYANQLLYASKFVDLNGEDTVAKLFFTQDLAQLNTVAKNFGLKDSSELMAFKSKRGIENFLQKKYKLPDFT